MKLTPKVKTKTEDLHIRISKQKREQLNKLCLLNNTSITTIFEQQIERLSEYHKIQ